MTTVPSITRSAYDAVVIGARVAGAGTALQLARRGLRVLVVDRDASGADTLSTHALLRAGVIQLHRWGLIDAVRRSGAPAIRRTTFHYADEPFEVAIRPRGGNGIDALYAPRRTVLDPIVVEAARAAGAEVAYGTRLLELDRDRSGRVRGVALASKDGTRAAVRAGIVVGADGTRSTVARLVAAPFVHRREDAAGTIYGYWSDLPYEGYHWFFRPGVSAGVIPTNDGQFCVSVTMPGSRFRAVAPGRLDDVFDQVARETSPALAGALRAGQRDGPLRGYPGQPSFLRRAAGPGWALVGDAGYFKDPITAHGISDALRDAELLARAVEEGAEEALERYETTRDALSRELLDVTARIASFEWDLDDVKRLHQAFSDAMKGEVRHLGALDGVPEGPPAPAHSGANLDRAS